MNSSSAVIEKAGELAASGHHAEVVEYLGARDPSELEESASLALLYGTAQARIGRHTEGLRWLDRALQQARAHEEQAVERRGGYSRGATAVGRGRRQGGARGLHPPIVV